MQVRPSEGLVPVKPFLRWAGGKTKLLPELMKHVPASFKDYHEPFLGGGALYLHLAATGRLGGQYFLSDTNADLINAWRVLRDVSPLVIIDSFPANTEEKYLRVRASSPTNEIERAVRFLYLNATCFNGLHRVNKSGAFNVPYGHRTSLQYENLLQGYQAYHRLSGGGGDMTGCLSVAAFDQGVQPQKGDFVYFDPPYVPISKTSSFTAYDKGGFGLEDQKRLASRVAELSERGCHVVVSNSAAPEVWDLYGGLGGKIHVVSGSRSVGANAESRGKTDELIIVLPPFAPYVGHSSGVALDEGIL